MGTSTQMGQMAGISVEIYDFSTPEERQILVDAFSKGHIKIQAGSVNNGSGMKDDKLKSKDFST